MFVHSDPIRVAALKDDRFALMHRATALLRGQLGLHRVGKNGDVAQDLYSRIRGLAGPNSKAILLDPFCPLRLILGTAVEASRCGVEDERGLGCEAREVSLRIVSTKSRDNGCCRGSHLSGRFHSVRLVHAGRSGNRSLGRVSRTAVVSRAAGRRWLCVRSEAHQNGQSRNESGDINKCHFRSYWQYGDVSLIVCACTA